MEFREQDFKYVMQNFSEVYIGARSTYEEAAEHDDMPSRLKSAIYRMIYDGSVSREETIATHLLNLKEQDLGYLFYSQLKIKIKVLFITRVIDKKGNEKEKVIEKLYSMEQFVHDQQLKSQSDQIVIQEIFFSKLNLALLSV